MTQTIRRAVVAAVIGNALEWYDFILYGLFAGQIAGAFFPARTHVGSLLLAVATFGVGFIPRPLGALVLGQFADRYGRRPALTLIIALMTLATAMIVFTPDYRRIGLAAPMLIVVSRLIQGFSVGGELGSSTALLIEAAPAGRRGIYASWQASSQLMSSLAGGVAGALVAALLTPAALADWGWRVPFALGLIIGPVGLYIRANVHEPAAVERHLHREAAPLRLLFTEHWRAVLRTVGLIALGTMATYVLELNMPTYAQRELGIPASDTFACIVVADLAAMAAAVWAGHLSDRHGPRAVMLPASIALGLGVFPSFVLLTLFPATATLMVLQTILLATLAMMTGPVYGLLGSLFPPEVRVSGLSVGYSLSVMLFGGFAGFITTGLIALTGDRHMPGVYVTAGAALTVAALTVGWKRGALLPGRGAAAG